MPTVDDIDASLSRLAAADDRLLFTELVRVTGLDPATHFRYANWSGISFAGCDLNGFDFTGARLLNCDFRDASICGARFDLAEIDDARAGKLGERRTNLGLARDWLRYRQEWTRPTEPLEDRFLGKGAVFRDAPFASDLVLLGTASFVRGSSGKGRWDEGPAGPASVNYELAVGRFPVTFDEWDFAAQRAALPSPSDEGWGRGDRPVINVSWDDAKSYCHWLSRATGQEYRLLSELEWEYACRAGSSTDYAFGDSIRKDHANFGGLLGRTSDVGTYPGNEWGLFDFHGNVWEWCEDSWSDDLTNAPSDGRPHMNSLPSGDRVSRGGSWFSSPDRIRSSSRRGFDRSTRDKDHGFRIVRVFGDLPEK